MYFHVISNNGLSFKMRNGTKCGDLKMTELLNELKEGNLFGSFLGVCE